jgi:uncharacterized protein (TIGR02145 family)
LSISFFINRQALKGGSSLKRIIFTAFVLSAITTIFAQDTQPGVAGQPFIDERDGKTYQTVVIDGKIWMAENFALSVKKGCWPPAGFEENVKKYGCLYDWKTALKICPKGWHIPSSEEWSQLIKFLGDSSQAAYKMCSTKDWDTHDYTIQASLTNSSGFRALAAGIRSKAGIFCQINFEGFWWASSKSAKVPEIVKITSGTKIGFTWNECGPNCGYSVRYVKN